MADNGGGFKMDGYVEVHERIKAFYEKHPEGSLQGSYETLELGGQMFVVYRAEAFRTAEDARPGVGYAYEPFPGKTPYTRDSELMNAETSAWGRAIAALGFEVHKGIASAAEVRNRSGGSGKKQDSIPPTDAQLKFLVSLAKQHGADPSDQENVRAYAQANSTGGRNGTLSAQIEKLKVDKDSPDEQRQQAAQEAAKLAERAGDWTKRTASDIPGELTDSEPAESENAEPLPF